ncbi:sensor histidine kinase [Gordonia sp. NPDC003429]
MPRRPFSLRVRVAAAASAGAFIIVTALAGFISYQIARNNLNHLDRQLETASRLVSLNIDVAQADLGRIGDVGALAVTLRNGDTVVAGTTTRIPRQPYGFHTVDINGTEYRVDTGSATLATGERVDVSVAAPTLTARTITRTQQRRVWVTGAVAVIAASLLGWVFGGRAVRPLVRLTGQVSATPPDVDDAPTGARETDELASAIRGMLARIRLAQEETGAALETARGFAAAAAHELRTPLTVMRTDLEVIGSARLAPADRDALLTDLLHTQGRIEATLQALENLAAGDLRRGPGEPVDVLEVADEAAAESARIHPGITVTVLGDDPLIVTGWGDGIRLALDNAITNAVKHGRAHRVEISGRREPAGSVAVMVDDDGVGIAPQERRRVFERFVRGSTAAASGSGLGLALIAQQAELHGGQTYFEDSPLGGVRLVIELGAPI